MTRDLANWLAYIEDQHPKSIDMGLERVHEAAARMGLGKPAKHVITVAGTNGKGSTVAFIEAIARAAGLKVGAYTSPHLLAYNERVRIDGCDVDDALLVGAFEAVEAARVLRPFDKLRAQDERGVPLTYFEYGTLAALWLFERSTLDLAILEVGLGGRLDAVNIVDPDVAVITTVDLDHQDWLGNDREAIGFEKAGIARAWTPLVLGEDDPPASVLRHAYAIGASTLRVGCDFFFDAPDDGAAATWRWHEVGFELDLPRPQLTAPAQLRNAATAIAALRALDVEIPAGAYAQGVISAQLPGRLQRIERDGVQIVIDVAHNPQAAAQLAQWLRQVPATGRTRAVFAALGDKDAAALATALAGQVDAWYLAGLVQAGSRGLPVEAFAGRLTGSTAQDGERFDGVVEALAAARAASKAGDRIVVFGSFHTAGAALRALGGLR